MWEASSLRRRSPHGDLDDMTFGVVPDGADFGIFEDIDTLGDEAATHHVDELRHRPSAGYGFG